jgi:DNA-binding Xre family transcriptional regulator
MIAQKDLGVPSVVLAKKANSTPQQVVRWRAQSNMKIHTIEEICKAMDLSINDFLQYENKESPN